MQSADCTTSGVPRGAGGGGHGPRAQALEGALVQLVGANFNGANAMASMGPELSRAPISLGVIFVLKTFFFSLVVVACRFFFTDVGFTKQGGWGAPIQALAPGRWSPSGRHWVLPRGFTLYCYLFSPTGSVKMWAR